VHWTSDFRNLSARSSNHPGTSPRKDVSLPAIENIEQIHLPDACRRERIGVRVTVLLVLVAFSPFAALPSSAQTAGPAPAIAAQAPEGSAPKQSPESELIFEGQGSVGNYKIFAAGTDSKFFTAGVEYDRHSWGQFLGAQVYYVGEFLPFVLLDEPAKLDYYGNPRSTTKQLVPGIGVIPIGFRLVWLHDHAVEPYFMGKGGILGFTKKALSPHASYEDFTLHPEVGVEIRLTHKIDFRAGAGDVHFSNAFITPSNPGLDVMAYDGGICYRFQH
jgi:hypothetical protein